VTLIGFSCSFDIQYFAWPTAFMIRTATAQMPNWLPSWGAACCAPTHTFVRSVATDGNSSLSASGRPSFA